MSGSSLHMHGERDHGHLRTLFKRARNKLELSPVSMPSAERIQPASQQRSAYLRYKSMYYDWAATSFDVHSFAFALIFILACALSFELCGTLARSISRANICNANSISIS